MAEVALLFCDSYEIENVYNNIKRGIGLLGGLHRFFDKNEKILLKPNMLFAKKPEEAVTTHPSVFEAVIKVFLDEKFTLEYGDSPGIGNPVSVAKKTGLLSIVEKYNIPFADFNNGEEVFFEDGYQNKKLNLLKGAVNADAIVSISKMKTHQLTRITGAVKNQYGCVFGMEKKEYHLKLSDAKDFSKMLVDINRYLKPRLYIMDGILAMEGNGPSGGDPIYMNSILISDDPIALDSTFCRMIDLPPEFVATNFYGKEYGLGTYLDDEIEIVGDHLSDFVNKEFDVVRTPMDELPMVKVPLFIKNLLIPRPVINHDECKKCGKCIEACPVPEKAVNFTDDSKKNPPEYNYSICIRCYCCQEMCPHQAIYIDRPMAGRILNKIWVLLS